MNRLKRLITEAHRRSLWQVLGVYLVTSWVVLGVVDTLTGVLGLPGWVPSFALVLLVIGLPIVVATAVVQEGTPGEGVGTGEPHDGEDALPSPIAEPSTESTLLRRHLTWKRAILGGVSAFTILGVLAAAYLTAWTLGIGPVGSLVAQGALEEGERIILADFSAPQDDPALGAVVTDLLRVDLVDTPILRVVELSELQDALVRMQAGDAEAFTAELAREVAIREGIKAVLEGDVARAGAGYALTATLRHAETGRSLAAFRETARSDEEVITAIDRLSRKIRERVGESLRTIHESPPLEQVTTADLEALRLYSRAIRASWQAHHLRAIPLLEEALAEDPDFAMAWRLLAAQLFNMRTDPTRQREAAVRAYELRDRLSTRERYLTTAYYHRQVTQDMDAVIDAYLRALELDASDRVALNNLALAYAVRRDFDEATDVLARLTTDPGAPAGAFANLVVYHLRAARVEEARAALELGLSRFPDYPDRSLYRSWVLFYEGREEAARSELERHLQAADGNPVFQVSSLELLAALELRRGRLDEARRLFEETRRFAAGLDPSVHWRQILVQAQAEVVAGAVDRAWEILSSAEAAGDLEEVPLEGRQYARQGRVLAAADRPALAEAVLRQWEAEVPVEQRGRMGQGEMEIVRALILLQGDEAEASVRTLERARAEMRCETCGEWVMGWALREAGRHREAAAEWETALSPETGHPRDHIPIQLWTLQRMGPLHEELGDTEGALHHYRHLVELWADADEELQPVVQHARERIAALGEAGG